MLKDSLPEIKTELPGPRSRAVIEKRAKAVPASIGCAAPYVISRGEGAMIEDIDGNIVMDWVGGIGALNVGYSNPEVVKAVQDQAERYFHPQINTLHYSEYIDLAERLNTITPGEYDKKTAFFNSGSEAVDNAVKIARKYSGKTDIIAYNGCFHGRTFMAMTLTSGQIFKAGFMPLAPGVHRAEFPNEYRTIEGIPEESISEYYLEKLRYMFVDYIRPDKVAAIIIEPIQGEGGFIKPPMEYIQGLRKLCDEFGILLIADEVQTGYCRTGRMFATDYWADAGVYPDILVTAKAMGGGMPISAITAKAEIMDSLAPGEIGGTYGGNPLACASSLKVIEILERDNYAAKAVSIGEKCSAAFAKWYEKYDAIGTFRVSGAMVSLEFVKDRRSKEPFPEAVGKILSYCREKGLILKSAGSYDQIVRALMPLVVTDGQIEKGLEILEEAISRV